MSKPEPIWEKWRKDPKTAEKYYIYIWIGMIALNIFIMFGVLAFIYFWWVGK